MELECHAHGPQKYIHDGTRYTCPEDGCHGLVDLREVMPLLARRALLRAWGR